jgi:hypothetical protein
MIQDILTGFFLFTACIFAVIAGRLFWAFHSNPKKEGFDEMPEHKKDDLTKTFAASLFFWFLTGCALILAYIISK